MDHEFTDADLESYLDETLHPDLAVELEKALKRDKQLVARMSEINGRRDAGIHTLGEIWRRYHIGVPSREQMAAWLLGELSADHSAYIDFRIKFLKCRHTIAKKNDLENQSAAGADPLTHSRRRKKYFDSSESLLKKNSEKP